MSTVHLVRHGQATTDLFNYDDLSDLGARQLRSLGEYYRPHLTEAGYVCGTIRRHRLSAEGFLRGADQSPGVRQDERFNEFDFLDIVRNFRPDWQDPARMKADLEGQVESGRFFLRVFRQAMLHWMTEPAEYDFLETWPDFVARTQAALADLDPSQSQWIFTSGGVISSLVAKALDMDGSQAIGLNLSIANASVTNLKNIGGKWRLVSFNQTQYLLDHPQLLTFR